MYTKHNVRNKLFISERADAIIFGGPHDPLRVRYHLCHQFARLHFICCCSCFNVTVKLQSHLFNFGFISTQRQNFFSQIQGIVCRQIVMSNHQLWSEIGKFDLSSELIIIKFAQVKYRIAPKYQFCNLLTVAI